MLIVGDRESAEGQALELGWQRDNRTDVTDEDYLQMVLQKTCWLGAIYPLRVGCLIGARGRMPLDPLIRLGFFYGAAFQIQDDLLNLEAGPAYGKEINEDLREGKRTLMIIRALRHGTREERRELTEFLWRPRAARSTAAVARIRALLERSGAIDHARTVAAGLAGAALYEFDKYFEGVPPTRDLDFMRSLVTWVVERSH
jgi:geranylgeranyl diphosphate synthase type II